MNYHSKQRELQHPLHLFTHCPKCGSAQFEENNIKSKRCKACNFVYYFNPSAAVVAIITNPKGEILVCRRAHEPALGTLDLPGGFVDSFETGEEAITREVMEETGLQIERTRYLFSLPNTYLYSGFEVHTLDQFFRCEVESLTPLMAADDVAEAYFCPIDQLDPLAFGLDSIRQGVEELIRRLQSEKF